MAVETSLLFSWPDPRQLDVLLRCDLLLSWLRRTIAQLLVVRLGTPSSLDDNVFIQQLRSKQEQLGCKDAHLWPEWCRERQLDPAILHDAMIVTSALPLVQQQLFSVVAQEQFLASRSGFDQVLFGALQTRDAGLAQEWYHRLRERETSFAELAPFSVGPSQRTGGQLGPMRVAQIPSPVDRLIQRSEPGIVQPPLPLQKGSWVVVQLFERIPATWTAELEAMDARCDAINHFHIPHAGIFNFSCLTTSPLGQFGCPCHFN